MIFAFLIIAALSFSESTGYDSGISEPDSLQGNFILGIDDLFRQTGLYFTTSDRMTSMIHTDLYGAYGPQPDFSLNGIPFNASFFGLTYTQLIPVPLSQIHGIQYREGYDINQGYLHQHGAIHLNSTLTEPGLTVFTSGQYGHNGNEPGPWVFDPERMSPNIERFGPWADAGLIYRSGSWYLKGVSRFHSYKNMHPFVQSRTIYQRMLPDQVELPDVRISSSLYMAEAGITLNRTDLTLQYIRSEIEDEHLFMPLGREVPTKLQFDQYSLSGETRFSSRLKAHYLYQEYSTRTDELVNRFGHRYDWSQSNRILSGSLTGTISSIEALIGSKIELQQSTAPGLQNHSQNLITLYSNQKKGLNESLQVELGQSITIHKDQKAVQSFLKTTLKRFEHHSVDLTADYSEQLPVSIRPVESMILAGYDLFDRLNISAQLPERISKSRHLSFTGKHTYDFDRSIRLVTEIKLIRHLSYSVPFQQVMDHPQISTIPGVYTLFDNESGTRFHLKFSAKHQPNQKFTHKWTFSHNSTLQGTEQLDKYWDMTPSFFTVYEAEYSPYKDLDIVFLAQYRSGSTWHEFERMDGEFARTFGDEAPVFYYPYTHSLPRHLMVHLGVSKWFWNQRVRGVAMLNNLLNRPYQTHPIGAIEEFGYLVRVELLF